MTGNTSTCHVSEKSGNILTCKGKLFYAQYLYTPQKNKQGKEKHTLEICFKPDADLTGLKNAMGVIALVTIIILATMLISEYIFNELIMGDI